MESLSSEGPLTDRSEKEGRRQQGVTAWRRPIEPTLRKDVLLRVISGVEVVSSDMMLCAEIEGRDDGG